jgi:potassium-dependent mechanosensitive channel
MRRNLIYLLIAALAVAAYVWLPGLLRGAGDVGQQVETRLSGPGPATAPAAPPRATEQPSGAVLLPDGAPDYDAWQNDASRAATVIGRRQASDDAFEALRAQLSSWRQAFNAEAARHAGPVALVQAQLDALGPAPEENETEPATIAEKRRELLARMQADRVPMLLAQAAAAEAGGYIAAIDSILRERRTTDMVTRGPSPFNPMNWRAATGAVESLWGLVAREFRDNWTNTLQAKARAERSPGIAVLGALGLLMLISGGRLIGRAVSHVVPQAGSPAAAGLRWLLVRCARLVVRLAGLVLLLIALELVGLQGARASNLVELVGTIGLTLLIAQWLSATLFASGPEAPDFLGLPTRQRSAMRRSVLWLGVVAAVAGALDLVRDLPAADDDLLYMFDAPLLVLSGLLLLRHATLLRGSAAVRPEDGAGEAGDGAMSARMVGIVSVAVRLVGVVAPVLALAGYFRAADLLVHATIGSLALAGTLMILQRIVVGGLSLLLARRGAEPGGPTGLIPILFGFALVVAALPLFALIWGVRWAVLVDLWEDLRDGVTVGGITLTVQNVATLFLVFLLGYILTGLVKGALSSTILPRTRLDIGARDAIVTGTGYVGIILAAVLAVSMAGINLTGLAFIAGALSVGIGFGLRTIVENFVSGIILLVERPIKQGDWIDVGGTMGYVREISVRSTRIETFDRSDVVVPNADLITGKVTNYTYSNLVGRLIVPVGVAYGSDVDKVRRILSEIAEANPMVVLKPPPSVLFRGFGDSALNFEVRAILRDVNWVLSVETEINTEIARRFAEEGIEIPFPQRDLWIRNAGELRPAPAHATPAAPAAQVSRPEDRGQMPAPGEDREGGDDR